jgi:molybdopterin converting factor small subunit
VTDAVTVRLLGGLAGAPPPDGRLTLAPGDTVATLTARCGVDPAALGTVLVNGHAAQPDTRLAPGDAVLFLAPISGG